MRLAWQPHSDFKHIRLYFRDVPGGPVAKSLRSQCTGPGSIRGQGTGSHMLQLRDALCQN